ncbi:MAG TPA: agmatine deiminase family protein [Gammaproteobacteria bacterium]|nr:agmatine deiminase family protein [Gammaproteobacteria bacterium]
MSRRLPAEWERQSAVLLAWPHEDTDWSPWLDAVEAVYAELAAVISRRQRLLILCRESHHRRDILSRLHASGAAEERLVLHAVPYDDTWVRDYGPITVLEKGRPRLLDFTFNGWGGKYPAARDNAVNQRLHAAGVLGRAPLETVNLVLEGGSIESDGAGTLLTTRRCLLHPQRNPGRDQSQLEAALCRHLGAGRVLWLEHGEILGDDTDGHIDMLVRFCGQDTLAYACCNDPADEHYGPLRLMEEELKCLRTKRGRPYRLAPLPLPAPVHDEQGRRLPASHANFLVINGAVLMPAYDDPADETARRTLQACFPGHSIHPVHATPLIRQHGSIHCVTMQLPAGVL